MPRASESSNAVLGLRLTQHCHSLAVRLWVCDSPLLASVSSPVRPASLAHLLGVQCGTFSPGLALNSWVLLIHNCHNYDMLAINSARLKAASSGASVYPSMACSIPERSQGCCCGREGEVAVGRLAGRVCFLSLTPTAPAWRKWQGLCGYLWRLPCLTGAKDHLLPCSVSLSPAGKSPLPLLAPPRNRRDALLLPGFQKQQVSLPVPGQGLMKAGRCPPLLL